MIAPDERSFDITKASWDEVQFIIDLEPAVLGMSYVSMLSLTRTGMQNKDSRFLHEIVQWEVPSVFLIEYLILLLFLLHED